MDDMEQSLVKLTSVTTSISECSTLADMLCPSCFRRTTDVLKTVMSS